MIKKIIKNLFVGSYSIEIVKNDSELCDQIYAFRYNLYCLVDKLLKKEDYPNEREKDEFDDHSVFLVAFNKKREIIGLIRIVSHSKHDFPTIEEFNLHEEAKNIDKEYTVDISRFMIRPDYRKTLLVYNLYKAAFLYSQDNNIKYWVGCVEDWLLKSLQSILGELKLIGKPVFCFNATNYPFIIDLEEANEKIKKNKKVLYYFLNRKDKKIKI